MRKSLLAVFVVLVVAALAAPAFADAPVQCSSPLALSSSTPASGQGAATDDHNDRGKTLEKILAESPQDPQTKSIDSGICCTSKSQCPTVSGYAKRCSSGSCWSAYTCLYRPL